MWRSFFLALGISMVIFGVECLGVDKMILTIRSTPSSDTTLLGGIIPQASQPKVFSPQATPAVPWILISTGTVICLYSFTLYKN